VSPHTSQELTSHSSLAFTQAVALQQHLRAEFPGLGDQLKIKLNEDPGTTGNFEVTLNMQLIHSKKKGGKGKCQDPKEREDIFAQIRSFFESSGIKVPLPDADAKKSLERQGGCILL
jgi:selT/selW/selH-like putative selenoprotein